MRRARSTKGGAVQTARAYHRVPHAGLAAVLVLMACDNDTCPGALAGRRCLFCEQCAAEGIDGAASAS